MTCVDKLVTVVLVVVTVAVVLGSSSGGASNAIICDSYNIGGVSSSNDSSNDSSNGSSNDSNDSSNDSSNGSSNDSSNDSSGSNNDSNGSSNDSSGNSNYSSSDSSGSNDSNGGGSSNDSSGGSSNDSSSGNNNSSSDSSDSNDSSGGSSNDSSSDSSSGSSSGSSGSNDSSSCSSNDSSSGSSNDSSSDSSGGSNNDSSSGSSNDCSSDSDSSSGSSNDSSSGSSNDSSSDSSGGNDSSGCSSNDSSGSSNDNSSDSSNDSSNDNNSVIFIWLFNGAVSTTRLFGVDEINDTEMVFGRMRPGFAIDNLVFTLRLGKLRKNPTRRIDIAINRKKSVAEIIDSTIRFEQSKAQPLDIDKEKKEIYESTIPYFRNKHNVQRITVTGLLLGSRGTVPKFFVTLGSKTDSYGWQIAEVTCIGGGTIFSYTSIDARRLCIVLKDTRQKPWRQLYSSRVKSVITYSMYQIDHSHVMKWQHKMRTTILSKFHEKIPARWAGHVARMGESRNAYRVSVGRPEGKRLSGRPRHRWEDNIKMDLREVGYDGRDWINLAQDRDQWRAYVRVAMNLRVP
ncbi:hypothetical protein ANN_18513 [Periplaneta americana]|uniref:Uncharacterized protein n=1 Tax=Periplaneta americana TaxID=6978 RepID=A0ABQ8SPG1_PERAM|nr:hypothetical protein ANN_18513 [Periplaneta americana]